MRLHRAREDVRRADEVRQVVQEVLGGQKIVIEDTDADAAVDLLIANLFPVVQGLVREELKRNRVYVADEADAVLSQGLPASPGFGIGAPVRWKNQPIYLPTAYVLLISNRDTLGKHDPRPAMEQSVAVVTWDGGMTSHIAVACRTIGRAAVIVSAPEAEMLCRKKFLVVDGSTGAVRSYHRPPPVEASTAATPKRSKRQRRRSVGKGEIRAARSHRRKPIR
jgi:phosphohistidine swiveling domain-containing protein